MKRFWSSEGSLNHGGIEMESAKRGVQRRLYLLCRVDISIDPKEDIGHQSCHLDHPDCWQQFSGKTRYL